MKPNPQETYANKNTSIPLGGKKLVTALKTLLETKDFNSITTAEISKLSGTNEALIYRYFKDKRGLLHQVLMDYLMDFNSELLASMKTTKGAAKKMRQLIRSHIAIYDKNRVLAKILLLEVRNFPGYFESDTYKTVKNYGRFLKELIEQGVEEGSICDGIPVTAIRDLILGGIEHQCMAPIIFQRKIDVEGLSEQLLKMIFDGIGKKD